MKFEWIVNTTPETPIIKQVLNNRNLSDRDLLCKLDDLPDESNIANIEKIADRIQKSLFKNEPIIIFGHDDPDGITSTYILYRYLESCGFQRHHYFIPNRNLEHHGIQQSFIDFVKEGNYKLVITVDNGISALRGVEELKRLGCDVIITDHHLIQPEHLPNAYAILNPQLPECHYPFKMLAGVGVVLMLIRYLSKVLEHSVEPALYFWASIGSIADKVPMTGVNRILIRYVFENWDNVKDKTIDFLLRNYNRINSDADRFCFMQYCSRLIANGREHIGQHIAMKFLLQLSDDKAKLFQQLETEKNKWEHTLNSVFQLVDKLLEDFNGSAFIYYDDEDLIPYTLLGTAATYVVNTLNIPALFLKKKSDVIVCEGRCCNSFNMVDAFNYCKNSLLQFGGHAKAAGFTMLPDKYNDFIEFFHVYLKLNSDLLSHEQKLVIDAVVSKSNFRNLIWQELQVLLPYGQENPEPLLLVKNCSISFIKEQFSIDYNNIKTSNDLLYDFVVQLKGVNLVKLIDYRVTVDEQ